MKDIDLSKTKDSIFLKEIKKKAEISKSDKQEGYLIDADEKTARSIISSLGKTKKIIAIFGRDDAFNRRALETLKIDYLVSPELGNRRDTLKQRDSGLNHVLAKIAAEKGIVIVIDFADFNKLKGKDRALRLGRIMQNIKICRKAGCKIKIWGCDDVKALESFGLSIGMSSVQTIDLTLS